MPVATPTHLPVEENVIIVCGCLDTEGQAKIYMRYLHDFYVLLMAMGSPCREASVMSFTSCWGPHFCTITACDFIIQGVYCWPN